MTGQATIRIGDMVDRKDFKNHGKVIEILDNGQRVRLKFKVPREPKRRNYCDECGWPGMLSEDGATGEIVCMMTGCGYGHGFEEWEKVVETNGLINITNKRIQKERQKLIERIEEELSNAVTEGLITEEAKQSTIKSLEKELF